ncbi:SAM-dependent methyltransferase [Nonomuraea glycinis]|uniref:SAM-dependent methyltransferase n=1 Tax=Nonomuraea glycinis TaxID=2047744 RepID=UPI0033A470F5
MPGIGLVDPASDNCLRRMVATAACMGLRQFLDVGQGPDQPSYLHDVAKRSTPDACYVYADLRTGVDDVFRWPAVRARIDLEQPTAVVLGSVLHFLADDEIEHFLTALWQRLVPDSLLLITAATSDLPGYTPDQVAAVKAFFEQQAGKRVYLRSGQQILDPLSDCLTLSPGLVRTPAWHAGYEADLVKSPAPYHLALAVQIRPDRDERHEQLLRMVSEGTPL